MKTDPLAEVGFIYTDSVGHAIARALLRHGIDTVFGQSLPSAFMVAGEELGIKQIAYRTENAGGYMADAFARVSGKVAVVTAQNGPAAALLVAPLAEAHKVSVPVLALIQDIGRLHTDKNAFQDLDHIAMLTPVTKWVRRVAHAERIDDYIDQALAVACSGRPGPVALLLPADLLKEVAAPATRKAGNLGCYPLDRTSADPARIQEAADALAGARKPVIIAGGGVHTSRAYDSLAALSARMSIPVATTVMGKGAFDENDPLALGVCSYFLGPNGSGRYLKGHITEADVIVLVGTRTNQNGTDSWNLYPPGATYIHIDVDGLEVGRNYEAIRLVGDARLTLTALVDACARKAAGPQDRKALVAAIERGRERHLAEARPSRESQASPIRPERVMAELDRQLQDDDIVVADASYSSIWIANYVKVRKAGQRFITPRGLAGLGWGFPMALGAKVARCDAAGDVFCVAGDGGFGHVWSELETATRMGLKVILIVLNNGILGFQKHGENVVNGKHTTAVDFAPVDHAAIARACGCNGIRVSDPSRLAAAFAQARQESGTTLIEVMTDENAFPPITFFSPDAE